MHTKIYLYGLSEFVGTCLSAHEHTDFCGSHSHTWAGQHRRVYVSLESNNICCHLTAWKTQCSLSSFSPSILSLFVFPLCFFLLLFGTVKLLQSSCQALHASRVQFVFQTVCSQHTVHNIGTGNAGYIVMHSFRLAKMVNNFIL